MCLLNLLTKGIHVLGNIFWCYGFCICGCGLIRVFLYTNLDGVIIYWLAGLYFDASHTAGNVVFYLCLYHPLVSVFKSSFSTG